MVLIPYLMLKIAFGKSCVQQESAERLVPLVKVLVRWRPRLRISRRVLPVRAWISRLDSLRR